MDTKPLIGISANYAENNSKLAENYYKSVVAAGGIPVIVPVTTDSEVLERRFLCSTALFAVAEAI